MFNVGDKVKVSEWENMRILYGCDEFGDIPFNRHRTFSKYDRKICGKSGEVVETSYYGYDKLYVVLIDGEKFIIDEFALQGE